MTDRIDILIAARNQTGGAFNEVKQQLSGLNSFADSLNRGLVGLGAAAGIGAVVAGIQQIGSAIDDLARRGAIFEQLSSVLGDFAASVDETSQAFVEAGRRASAGTIGDFDLILNANRAIQFEVAKTSDQYAKLIELATALGRAQGISDTQALEFITTGIARESRLILDNLGLIIDLGDATKTYAASLGKKANELTQAERKQALLNEAYRQGATAIAANRDAVNSAATQFERMDASIQNAKDALGALFGPAVAVVAKNIADAAAAAAENVQQVGKNLNVNEAAARIQILQEVITGLNEALALEEGARGTQFFDQSKIFELTTRLRDAQDELAIATDTYFASLRQLLPAQEQNAAAMNRTSVEAEAQANILRLTAGSTDEAESAQRRHAKAARDLQVELSGLYGALDGASGQLRRIAWESIEAGQDIGEVTERVRILRGELANLQSAGASVRSAIFRAAAGVSGIVGDAQALALARQQVGELDFAISALNQRLLDGTISQAEFDYELAKLNDNFTGTFSAIQDADRAAKQLAKEGLADAERAANDAERAFDNLKSKVAGVLQGALNLDVGVDTEEILGREDAINENARRLADVAVKGFDSPWFDYLKNEFPALFQEFFSGAAGNEGVKKQAARLLRDFEDGLRPELLDKEKAKERVRRILLGEANIAQLAQEIAQELSAEFGGSISLGKIQATANAALGVDESGGEKLAATLTGAASAAGGQLAGAGSTFRSNIQAAVGEFQAAITQADTQLATALTGVTTNLATQLTGAGKAFRDGIVSALDGIGEVVAIAIDKQFRAENNLKIVSDAGRANGEAWSSGFLTAMDSLSGQVLEKLATLVSPYIESVQARNATLNGAN